MKLNQLFPSSSQKEIKNLMTDSRLNLSESLFFCLKGLIHDGHLFVQEAIDHGAIAIVYSDPLPITFEHIEYIKVENVLESLNEVAKVFFDDPSQHLTLFGVTGTNGKSTIAKTIKEIYTQHTPTGYAGTISIEYGQKKEKPDYTTPETVALLQLLNRMRDEEMQAVALEISSQGLDQSRADALKFDVGIFTNLTHDHLDYHGNLENYYLAKKHLFDLLKDTGCALINIDDAYGARLYQEVQTKKFSFSLNQMADYQAVDMEYGSTFTKFTLVHQEKQYKTQTNFVSQFNLSNLLAVIGACHQSGMELEDVLRYIDHIPQVDGRMLVIQEEQKFNCIVDYAHTPDGFEKIYEFAKTITPYDRKIISVFGAAGKRDTKKRAILGEISDRYCKMIVLTEEDPRNESAMDIAHQIASGIHHSNYVIVLDRYDAIRQALELANEGDTVLILAKGNEQYLARQFGKEYWMGDERAVREILKEICQNKGDKNELQQIY